MISNDSNVSQGWSNWLKWLISTGIALLAAGGSVVAMLDYFNQHNLPGAYTRTETAVASATDVPLPTPSPTQTTQPATVIYDTPTPAKPNPANFVISYWQNVSNGRYENAWAQLSQTFRQTWHNNDYSDYLRGYQRMNLCRIVVSNVNLISQADYSAVLTAQLTYYAGSQCRSSEYNFEMWLVYDDAGNAWLFDRNIQK
jgi:hypothetical protein